MNSAYYKTGLTGGTENDLDGISVYNLADGDIAAVFNSNIARFYVLDIDSGETADDITIIEPATDPGDVRWIEQISTREQVGVFAHLTAAADTTVTTASTYYAIEGTFNNSISEYFTAVEGPPPGIQADYPTTQYYKIEWATSLQSEDATRTCTVGIAKNGTTPETCSLISALLKTADEPVALCGCCVLELEKDDVVTLVLTSSSDGDVITVNNFQTNVKAFF